MQGTILPRFALPGHTWLGTPQTRQKSKLLPVGESIHGTKAGPFAKPFAWGRCTAKPLADGKTRLYLHVFDWPANGRIEVHGLRARPSRAYLLSDTKQAALPVGGGDGNVTLAIPVAAPDPADSVVVLEVEP